MKEEEKLILFINEAWDDYTRKYYEPTAEGFRWFMIDRLEGHRLDDKARQLGFSDFKSWKDSTDDFRKGLSIHIKHKQP